MDRKLVYNAIDTEREYQNHLERNHVKEQNPMEQICLIEELISRMKQDWYDLPGYPSMDYMRKIAAIAVRSMEENGVSERDLSRIY